MCTKYVRVLFDCKSNNQKKKNKLFEVDIQDEKD